MILQLLNIQYGSMDVDAGRRLSFIDFLPPATDVLMTSRYVFFHESICVTVMLGDVMPWDFHPADSPNDVPTFSFVYELRHVHASESEVRVVSPNDYPTAWTTHQSRLRSGQQTA